VNREFRTRLLADPRSAAAGYDLAVEELELLAAIRADSVDQLARQLVTRLCPEDAGSRTRTFGLPGGAWPRRPAFAAATGGQAGSTMIRACLSPEP
jgi:hypothetical protein